MVGNVGKTGVMGKGGGGIFQKREIWEFYAQRCACRTRWLEEMGVCWKEIKWTAPSWSAQPLPPTSSTRLRKSSPPPALHADALARSCGVHPSATSRAVRCPAPPG